MRQQHLVDSGRLLAPVLRPHFVSRRQLDALSRLSAQMAEILERLEAIAFATPRFAQPVADAPGGKDAGRRAAWL